MNLSILRNYLNQKKIQQILKKRPGDEGFSLVELVVVIAVLAILAAIAIPAFQGVQARAKTAAVKNGLVNGVKECVVSDGLDLGAGFDVSQAFKGNYSGYTVTRYNNENTCYKVYAQATQGSGLPDFQLIYNNQTGVSSKACTAGNTIGCNNGQW